MSVGKIKPTLQEDNIIRFLRKYGLLSVINIIPISLRKILRKIIFSSSRRTFSEKPQLEDKYKRMILNLTLLDIAGLERITKKDFSKWKKIN